MLRLKLFAVSAALALVAGAGQAADLVFDDFEGYGNATVLNFTGFSNLTVSDGTVDYVDNSDSGLITPYGHGHVDMDGSTDNAGILSSDSFAIAAGTDVLFQFDAGGNRRGGSDASFRFGFNTPGPMQYLNVFYQIGDSRVDVGDATTTGYYVVFTTLPLDYPWTHMQFGFTAGVAGPVQAYLQVDSNDNVGPLVDNFQLSAQATAAIPEPATWALMIAGFGLAGGALRRRRVVVAAA